MLFITNRAPLGDRAAAANSTFNFDPKCNAPSCEVFYCLRNQANQYTELGSTGFMQQLKQSPYQQLLFYIHGFSNQPEPDIFPRAQQLQQYFDQHQHNHIQVVPIIWPCDTDIGIVKDYWDDQKSADASGMAFARVLQKLLVWQQSNLDDPCLKRMNVLAHSMGNRVLRETLYRWEHDYLGKGVPLIFRHIFLVAADVNNQTLGHAEPGRLISQAARNVSVYFASDDLALRASKVSNLANGIASRRLGHSGPEDKSQLAQNVYSIDCDDINTHYDFPKGHSYFINQTHQQPGVVFQHLLNTLISGRVNATLANQSHQLSEHTP
ncbi:alpha/beta hydrolase [Motilimonas cestriensis]|uniref:Alpha/beta hydrolase n=1 Tax=Motilimonas cestriensis TaxID=2742685 RepID=A0ABS8W7C7_9GAMM|nr:alpha/beta hydrolase [Motilimonas cestriensis]MCE2594907.1 alpha/beta hydrolase [Motilimonas cestriensis]